MKAAVLRAFDGKLAAKEFVRFEDLADPKISRPTNAIVRIGGAGVCRTDLHVIEGVRRSKVDVNLPYIMGHEYAGWIEAVGSDVEELKVGGSVICHPLVTSGHCLTCLSGDDMHAPNSSFPGINAAGGYVQYLLTGQCSLIKLPKALAPKDVGPYTDAGLTANRAAKKASRHLLPGEKAVVLGPGGFAHIQVLAALFASEIIVVDRAEKSLDLVRKCGAHLPVKAHGMRTRSHGLDRRAGRRSRARFSRRRRCGLESAIDDRQRRLSLHRRLRRLIRLKRRFAAGW